MRRLVTVDEVIDALGGTGSVAELVGKHPPAISNWKRRGKLPSNTFLILSHELDERGISAPPSLWGIPEPERA